MSKSSLPYGGWPSLIDSELLSTNSIRLGEPQLDQGHCYWLEQRPEEKGRSVVVCQVMNAEGEKIRQYDVTPEDINVRTKAHEYGGGSYCVDQGVLYFVNADDQRVYSMPVTPYSSKGDNQPTELSPEGNYHYADFFLDHPRQQLLCVCERLRENTEPESSIISLRLDGSSTIGFNVLVFGNDFYSNPSVSPDGTKVAWLTWNHPNMPWDESECWLADFNSTGMLHKHRKVAGTHESIFQPQWSPTGDLLFISDRNNWWNIYSYNTYNKYTEHLLDMPAEFATPQWVFGMSTYGFLNSYTLFCTFTEAGQWHLGTIDLMTQSFKRLELPFSYIEGIACQDDDDTAVFIGATESSPTELIRWKQDHWQSIASSSTLALDKDNLSHPKAICFPNSRQQTVHGLFYAPTHVEFEGPTEEKPPLIVMSHGGPTGATHSALSLKIQYWTNRGFAVFDINYSGSTGYGRAYRHRLYSQWGLLDVDDLCCAAEFCIEKQWVDKEKIAIRGSSAGGYSVLATLTFRDTFKAGASLYGIGDLSSLAEDTHKFESCYLNQLVGEYPKDKAVYQQRSPLFHTDQLNCPVIFLQGLEDKVVPPHQAESMVASLKQKNIPVAYVTLAQEGHGFRQAKNIGYAIDVEYAFYVDIFKLNTKQILPKVPFVSHAGNIHRHNTGSA